MTLELRNISLSLRGRQVLDDVSALWSGGLVGLIGPNGAGKSSLMRVIAGLWHGDGEVLLDGASLSVLAPQARAKRLSFLPPERDMTWPLPVRDVVALGRHPHRGSFAPWTEGDERAVEAALDAVEARDLANRPVSAISNGERARVLLARALTVEAPVLLVDEAVAALDPAHQLQVMEVLKAEAAKGRLVVAVLHDLGLARRYCDDLVMIDGGKVHAHGAPPEVLTDENLAQVYGIKALTGVESGHAFVVPLERL